jgi:hypothetical protein
LLEQGVRLKAVLSLAGYANTITITAIYAENKPECLQHHRETSILIDNDIYEVKSLIQY